MDIVIALDFDGTLYPITDYDSEQMLLHPTVDAVRRFVAEQSVQSDGKHV